MRDFDSRSLMRLAMDSVNTVQTGTSGWRPNAKRIMSQNLRTSRRFSDRDRSPTFTLPSLEAQNQCVNTRFSQ